jgi:hypothetical protein
MLASCLRPAARQHLFTVAPLLPSGAKKYSGKAGNDRSSYLTSLPSNVLEPDQEIKN